MRSKMRSRKPRMPAAPSTSCNRAVGAVGIDRRRLLRALLIAASVTVVAAAAPVVPAAAQDAKLTDAERVQFVKRTLDAMSPAQRQALQKTIETEMGFAKVDAAEPAPPTQKLIHQAEKKSPSWWGLVLDAIGPFIALVIEKPKPTPSIAARQAQIRLASLEMTMAVLRGAGNAGAQEVFETIANLTRLAYAVCGDRVIERDDGIEYWKDDIASYFGRHADTVRSVGIIEVKGLQPPRGVSHCPPPYPEYAPVGTGFVAGKGLLVTNRHVLANFAKENSAGKWQITVGLSVRVAFARAHTICKATPVNLTVTGVAGVHPSLDLAVLWTGGEASVPPPLPIAGGAAKAREAIAVIGYPSCDGRVRRRDEIVVFGGPGDEPPVFHVERFQPGEVMAVDMPTLHFRHDASTLGGNSGSPVMRLSDGTVVGIHSGGVPYQYNIAIKADALTAFLKGLPAAP